MTLTGSKARKYFRTVNLQIHRGKISLLTTSRLKRPKTPRDMQNIHRYMG
jgi:hypothetical protein